jgi:hypothetical protein
MLLLREELPSRASLHFTRFRSALPREMVLPQLMHAASSKAGGRCGASKAIIRSDVTSVQKGAVRETLAPRGVAAGLSRVCDLGGQEITCEGGDGVLPDPDRRTNVGTVVRISLPKADWWGRRYGCRMGGAPEPSVIR